MRYPAEVAVSRAHGTYPGSPRGSHRRVGRQLVHGLHGAPGRHQVQAGTGAAERRRTDRGAVIVLDRRIVTKRYGRVFLESLPDCAPSKAPAAASTWPSRNSSRTGRSRAGHYVIRMTAPPDVPTVWSHRFRSFVASLVAGTRPITDVGGCGRGVGGQAFERNDGQTTVLFVHRISHVQPAVGFACVWIGPGAALVLSGKPLRRGWTAADPKHAAVKRRSPGRVTAIRSESRCLAQSPAATASSSQLKMRKCWPELSVPASGFEVAMGRLDGSTGPHVSPVRRGRRDEGHLGFRRPDDRRHLISIHKGCRFRENEWR